MALASAVTDHDRLERIEAGLAQVLAVLTPSRSHDLARQPFISSAIVEAGVEHELKALEVRHRLFPKAAARQCAWAILLAAYKHTTQRKPLSVSAAMSYSLEPGATALRHLQELEELGFIVRHPDLNDRRRYWLTISDEARRLMVRYFTELNC